MPTTFDREANRFAPCPDSPNCVSTQEERASHRLRPIFYAEPLDEARQIMRRVIDGMARAEIIEESGDYLHVTFQSRVLRAIDDVEFFFDDANKLIHFRSAARQGYADFGVNRRRMERIRSEFHRTSNAR